MQVVQQVRNNHRGPLTLVHESMRGKEYFKWGGFGSAAQDDVQEIPDYVLDSPNFRKIKNRKIVTVLEDHSADDQIAESVRIWEEKQKELASSLIAKMDRKADNDIIGLACMGPGERGSTCGASVPVRSKERNDRVPLCTLHASLEENFLRLEDEGKVKWQYVPTK